MTPTYNFRIMCQIIHRDNTASFASISCALLELLAKKKHGDPFDPSSSVKVKENVSSQSRRKSNYSVINDSSC